MALKLVILFLVFSVTQGFEIVDLLECSPPDFPANGGYGPRQDLYVPGDTIHYYCDVDIPGSFIGGNYLRVCEDTGAWSGNAPVCDAPTKFSSVRQSSTATDGEASLASDRQRITCSSTQGGQREEWIGTFERPGELIRVMLFLPKGAVSYEVILVKGSEEIVCGSKTANIDRHEWTFQNCPGPNNVGATGVKIRSLTNDPLRICEVAAHVLTSPKCTDPHVIVDSGRLMLTRHTATLVCDPGYMPGRERKLQCVREGQWNRKLLYCLPRE